MIDQAESPKNFIGKLCAITTEISDRYIDDSSNNSNDIDLDSEIVNSIEFELESINNDFGSNNSQDSIEGNPKLTTIQYSIILIFIHQGEACDAGQRPLCDKVVETKNAFELLGLGNILTFILTLLHD